MAKALLAIDQGTTSTRCILFTPKGKEIASAQQEFPQHYPSEGWVEHRIEDLWESTLSTLRQALSESGLSPEDIVAAGITNQRETTLVWNRETGEPVYPAIVWQDRRTAAFCESLKKTGHEPSVREKTGLLLDPYFSASKIRWILNEVPGAREQAEAGQLLFGTVDSYLVWRLSDGQVHATDATNASRTALFNIHKQCWDEELLALFDIPASLLPDVKDSADDFGHIAAHWLGGNIPIRGVAGDQQAALVGQACFEPGMCKSTYGTGCFLVMNTGAEPIQSQHQLLTTVAYRLNGKVTYALEGSIFMAGATIQWLRDSVSMIPNAAASEALAQKADPDQSVYLVPAFTGLGAPHWDPNARGAIVGMTRNTGVAEIVAAGLKSVAYQTKDLIDAIQADGLETLERLLVDGGMVHNAWAMQFLSDILQIPVERPENTETTAVGAACLAALGAELVTDQDPTETLWSQAAAFEPRMTGEQAKAYHDGWLRALKGVKAIR